MRTALRFFFFAFFSLLIAFFVIKPAHAQYNNAYSFSNTNYDVPKNLHTFSQATIIEVSSAIICQITGVDPVDTNRGCLGIDPQTKKIGYVKNGGGAIGVMGNLIGATYNLPIHSIDYIAYLGSNFGLTKPAFAAAPCTGGLGFCSLSPLIKAWTVFRDLAYFFLIIIFVLVGMAIMLRLKIDPRTVMTIGNQVPKIVIALILATLSFAIAGLLIDFMWFLIYLLINLFHQADPNISIPDVSRALQSDPINLLNETLIPSWLQGVTNLPNNPVTGSVVGIVKFVGGIGQIIFGSSIGIGKTVASIFTFATHGGWGWLNPGNWVPNAFAIILGILTTIAVALIVAIAVFLALFRVWFMLIKAFVTILIGVLLAPVWIIFGAVPGVGGKGFTAWLRFILSNILVFPVVVGMFLIAKVLMDSFGASTTPFVPIVGTGDVWFLGNLIGLGVILMTPSAAKWLQEALKAPKSGGTMIFQTIGGAGSVVSGTAKQAGGAVYAHRKGIKVGADPGFGAVMQRFFGRL